MARVDYEAMASSYDAGRDHPRERRGDWRRALAAYVDRGRPLLDLGAGTGQWSGLLSDWFGVDFVAVEPSFEMRMRAVSRLDSRVQVVAGAGEHLPMRDGGVGTAWVSAIWHHLTDPLRVAAELHRVLVPGGHLCVRGAFPDAGDALDLPTLRAFPEAAEVLATFPTIGDLVGDLERAGFVHLGVESAL